MRIMGLDFGSRTVGVAVSDPLFLTAQGVEIIRRKSPGKLRQTLARIDELIREYEVGQIVLGYPKHMNNTEGERCGKTLEFRDMLVKRTGLEVTLADERLTTVMAEHAMIEGGIRRENRKDYVDKLAAVLILQNYLDSLASDREHPAAGIN
ncbi:MAG: Holliday junction resolvase RuvX [Lachnospiraceae bacterium]|nr:Holliday junction resolvase RuvX [Lachnospiraceae bacterium]